MTPAIDAIFTAVSAVCVTGLITLDTATHWSHFGKGVILVLIQSGGFGLMTLATRVAVIIGRPDPPQHHPWSPVREVGLGEVRLPTSWLPS